MKKIFLLILITSFSIFISSCGKETNETNEETEKREFFLEVKNTSEFDNIATLKKTGILNTSENITLSSNVSGRIRSIVVKSGDKIYENQTLAVIEDNIANYNLSAKSALNNLDSAKNSLDITKNALDSAKNGLQTSLNSKLRTEINYDSNKIKLEKSIADLKRNLNNLDLENEGGSSFIEIQKIDNSINRLNIEYDNLLLSNKETIAGFGRNLEKDLIVLKNYMDDVIYFGDEILGITDLNKNKNNGFEIFLGAKNSGQKLQSEDLLRDLINYRENDLENLNINTVNEENHKARINSINFAYSKIIDFLNSLDTTLSNTVESVGAISQAEISGFKANVGSFRNIYNANKSQILTLGNSISSFLETYKNSESSLLKQIENLEKDKNLYKTSLNLNVENNNATLNESIKSMELTLKDLDVSIMDAKGAVIDAEIRVRDAESRVRDAEIKVRDAEISYTQALIQLDKLIIKSPINGVVSDILVDRGQEVSSGIPLFSILNESSNEVDISFTKDELDYVFEGSKVYYNDGNQSYTGSIYSISRNADENFKYQAKVIFPGQVTYIGNILNLDIPITIPNKLVPINSIKINNSGVGTLNYYSSSGSIEQIEVNTGEVFDDKVEIIGSFEEDLDIILNYVDNYDSENFILKIK